jgi:hypothetical protein
MKPYVASFQISGNAGVNRDTCTVPNGFRIVEIIANVPADATIDIRDNGNSVLGSKPLPGGVFATANRRIRLPAPARVNNTTLELLVQLSAEAQISVVCIGVAE